MADTLIAFANDEYSTYGTSLNNAQTALKNAQDGLGAARDALNLQIKKLGELDAQIAAKRAKQATTEVPSDAATLVVEITALVAMSRRKQHDMLDARAEVGKAQASLAAAKSRLDRATAALAKANAAKETAAREDLLRQGWNTALATPPLANLLTDATAVLAGGIGTPYGDAKKKLEEIPLKLLDVTTARHDLWRERLRLAREAVEEAEDQTTALLAADGGLEADVQRWAVEFRRVERRLADFAQRAPERYQRALQLLGRIADPGNDILSDAQQTDVEAQPTPRGTAADHERSVLQLQPPVDATKQGVADAELAVRVKNPNATPAEVANDTGVTTAQGHVTTAEGPRDTAQDAFTADDQLLMNGWTAIIPDKAWRQVLDFLEATALLEDIGAALAFLTAPNFPISPLTVPAAHTGKPSSISFALGEVEKKYVVALREAAAQARSLAYLQDAIAERRALLEAAEADQPTRLLSAIRGDANLPPVPTP